MIEPLTVDPEEKAKLRRGFEFGAYTAVTQYLARTYGLKELRKFAQYWAELAAEGRRHLMSKPQDFMKMEAKVEKVDRDVERLDDMVYFGVVRECPLRRAINANRGELPLDYFCDNVCAIMYPESYRLLGLKSAIIKSEKGCKVEIDLRRHPIADG